MLGGKTEYESKTCEYESAYVKPTKAIASISSGPQKERKEGCGKGGLGEVREFRISPKVLFRGGEVRGAKVQGNVTDGQ